MKQILNKKTKKKGFTLIELIIVIAVIGIIAAIAVPSLMGTKDTFKIKADEKSSLTVARAVELLVVDETIPQNASGTITVDTDPSLAVSATLTVGGTAISDAIDTKIESQLTKSLQDIKKPQETGRDTYVINLTDGKVTPGTTTTTATK